ncbi:MAG: MFS transporter [Deltaproteobacteria bacterium]|nr:MFS transporter [Deltaproteobacteria bacterium]
MTHRPTKPFVFGITILPFAAAVGYLSIAAPLWLAQQGVSLKDIGIMSGVAMSPHALKFIWAPTLDIGSHRKLWFVGLTIATALLTIALAYLPDPAHHMQQFTLLATLLQIAGTTSAAAADGLMAATTDPAHQGAAGGWRMAGNVGATSILGAVLILVASKANTQIAGITLGVLVLLTALSVLFIDEPHPHDMSINEAGGSALKAMELKIISIFKDVWKAVSARDGWTGIVICLMPVGAGALTNLFSAMSVDYKASEEVVEWVNGLGGGVVGALGSLLGGYVADKMNRRVAYGISGGLTALSGIAMMLAPMTPTTYTWGVLLYNFANGIAFATLAAFILEMVGPSVAAATKYTVFIAIANLASSYVTSLDGAASELKLPGHAEAIGSRGALAVDAALTFVGIAVLMLMVRLARKPAAAAVPA